MDLYNMNSVFFLKTCIFICISMEQTSLLISPCYQEPGISGKCINNVTKWTFVRHFGCYSFQYGGCWGNQNKFSSNEECSRLCMADSGQVQPGHSMGLMIHGGMKVTDVRHFPWFAFIRAGFPDIMWRIFDKSTKQFVKQKLNDEKDPYRWPCSAILVTKTKVLTSDHCMWMDKPAYRVFDEEGEREKMKLIHLYKNIVTDESICYNKPDEKRGSLDNVAVKLYGTSYANANPKDDVKNMSPDTMFHPWFSEEGSVAFKVLAYKAVEGGVNAGGKGDRTKHSVDLAILTVDTDAFFKTIDLDLDKQLKRLDWVTKEKDRIKEKTKIYQIGSGRTGPGRTNQERQIYLSKKKFRYIPEKECLKETIKKPTLLNLQWDLCVKNEDESMDEHVYTMFGDSGGPGLEKKKQLIHDLTKAHYVLHYIHSWDFGNQYRIAVNVDMRKEVILKER